MLEAITSLNWTFVLELTIGVFVGQLAYRSVEYVWFRRIGVALVLRRPE